MRFARRCVNFNNSEKKLIERNQNLNTVPADDLHQNVIPFIPPQTHELPTSTHGVSFQTNISPSYSRIYFNTSSSSPLTLSSPTPLLPATASASQNHSVKEGFLVYSPSCQMPAADPLAKDVMKLFRRGNSFKFQNLSHYSQVSYVTMYQFLPDSRKI